MLSLQHYFPCCAHGDDGKTGGGGSNSSISSSNGSSHGRSGVGGSSKTDKRNISAYFHIYSYNRDVSRAFAFNPETNALSLLLVHALSVNPSLFVTLCALVYTVGTFMICIYNMGTSHTTLSGFAAGAI